MKPLPIFDDYIRLPGLRGQYALVTGSTRGMGKMTARLLAETPDPARAVIGLKNHGLTITGHDLEDVFSNIRGRLQTQVPMFA